MRGTRPVRSFVAGLLTIALAITATLAVPHPVTAAQSGNAGIASKAGDFGHIDLPDADPIVGTWVMTVVPDGPDAPPPFPQLLTFNEGGTFMQSATGPPIPGLGNPGHGAWKRINRRQVVATFIQFTFESIVQQNGSLKARLLLTLDERTRTLSSVDQVTIYDLDGNEIVTLTGVESGKKLKVEAPH